MKSICVSGFTVTKLEDCFGGRWIRREGHAVICLKGWRKLMGRDKLPKEFSILVSYYWRKDAKKLFVSRPMWACRIAATPLPDTCDDYQMLDESAARFLTPVPERTKVWLPIWVSVRPD